jgi:hypothetical protein
VSASSWHAQATAKLAELAKKGAPFDAFDLVKAGVPEPDNPKRWGSLFRAASTKGLIVNVGYHRSQQPGRAAGSCRTWKGAQHA